MGELLAQLHHDYSSLCEMSQKLGYQPISIHHYTINNPVICKSNVLVIQAWSEL